MVVRGVREVFGAHRSRLGKERARDGVGIGGDERAHAGFADVGARAWTRWGRVGAVWRFEKMCVAQSLDGEILVYLISMKCLGM